MPRFRIMRHMLGFLRFLAVWALFPLVSESPYGTTSFGYLSALNLPIIGCVGFRKTEGKLQFRW